MSNGIEEQNFIAIDDKITTAGLIVWWRLSGGLDLGELKRAWLDARLDPELLPEEPTLATALRRAVGELKTGDRFIRGLPKGGFEVVKVTADHENNDNVYHTILKAKLDQVGRLALSGEAYHLYDEVRGAFTRFQAELTQADVSPWLTWLMNKTMAVALRDTGGIYFIPNFQRAEWEAMVTALRKTTKHAIFGVPALRTHEAVKAIEDAISSEAEAAANSLAAELEANPEMSERALQNRIGKTNAIEEKLSQYEQLLGSRLEALHDRMKGLRASVSIAIVKAQVKERAENAA